MIKSYYPVKACESVILCKVKHYKTEFCYYVAHRLNKMKKTDKALLIIHETGLYLAIDKDFKSRDDWRFYRNVVDNWEGQEYLYINFNIDNGEPSRITKESAVDLINNFYIQYLQRAILAYSKEELMSNMKCPRIEDFGITRGEYFNMKEGNIEGVILNRNIKSDDLEDYVEY